MGGIRVFMQKRLNISVYIYLNYLIISIKHTCTSYITDVLLATLIELITDQSTWAKKFFPSSTLTSVLNVVLVSHTQPQKSQAINQSQISKATNVN